MADRAEERSLGLVASSQRLRFDGLLGELGCLPLALFRLDRASACPRGKLAHDDGRDEVDGEREPVLAVAAARACEPAAGRRS